MSSTWLIRASGLPAKQEYPWFSNYRRRHYHNNSNNNSSSNSNNRTSDWPWPLSPEPHHCPRVRKLKVAICFVFGRQLELTCTFFLLLSHLLLCASILPSVCHLKKKYESKLVRAGNESDQTNQWHFNFIFPLLKKKIQVWIGVAWRVGWQWVRKCLAELKVSAVGKAVTRRWAEPNHPILGMKCHTILLNLRGWKLCSTCRPLPGIHFNLQLIENQIMIYLFIKKQKQGSGIEACVERRWPVAQHLCQRGGSINVSSASSGSEYGLHPRPCRFHAWPPRLGAQLVDAPARHSRRRWCRHPHSPSPFCWISESCGQQRPIMGLGSWPQQTLPRLEKPSRHYLPGHPQVGREFHRPRFVLRWESRLQYYEICVCLLVITINNFLFAFPDREK